LVVFVIVKVAIVPQHRPLVSSWRIPGRWCPGRRWWSPCRRERSCRWCSWSSRCASAGLRRRWSGCRRCLSEKFGYLNNNNNNTAKRANILLNWKYFVKKLRFCFELGGCVTQQVKFSESLRDMKCSKFCKHELKTFKILNCIV